MKRFIARKVIKVPRYKLLMSLFLPSIILIISINFLLSIGLKQIDRTKLVNLLVKNSYGNIIHSDSFSSNKNNSFYQNVFGFPFKNEKSVMKENINLEESIKNSHPLIYLYNTFQTDKYQNTYYQSYSINPVVTQASLILQEDLKKWGIASKVETKSVAKTLKEHNIDYSLSYRGSRILLENAKKEYPSLEYFFDIGLSDDKKEATTYSSNELSYARILFIVGTENAKYLENQKLAISLNEKLDAICKGVSRGISLRGGAGYHGIYNEDFSPNTLLIYVGGKENTIDEVNRSLKILAEALKKHIKGEKS